MKNYFLMAGLFSALCFNAFSSNAQSSTLNCCNESVTISNEYCNKTEQPGIKNADIAIDSFIVTKDGTKHLLLRIQVSCLYDDAAQDARLVIVLPADVCDISVKNKDPWIKSYKQSGGRIEFCLGKLNKIDGTNICHITIRTGMVELPQSKKGTESFAGFVYSSTPDVCPLNNYRVWVNDKVGCRNTNPATLVGKGSIH